MELNWDNLTKEERTRYMQLQMSPPGGHDRSGYFPDDCGECGACGRPTMGSWCQNCYQEWKRLRDKLEARWTQTGFTDEELANLRHVASDDTIG